MKRKKTSGYSFWPWFLYAVAITLIVIIRLYTWNPIK